MSYKIVTNKPGGRVLMKVWGNTNINVATFQSNNSETISKLHLSMVLGGSEGSSNTLYYRANTSDANNLCLRIVSQDNVNYDLSGNGLMPDADLQTSNVIFVVSGTATFFLAEFKKESNYSVGQQSS